MLDELGSMLDGLTWAYFWNKPAKPAKLFSDFPDVDTPEAPNIAPGPYSGLSI